MSTTQNLQLPLLNSYIEHWASETPERTAIIQHEDGRHVSYSEFAKLIDFFALRLLDMGIGYGDRVATMLVLVPEHIFLMYACSKIGAIIAPLDVRLQEKEVVRDVNKIKPKAFFFLGNTPVRDFREIGEAVKQGCPTVEHLVQFTPNPGLGEIIKGALAITEMMSKKRLIYLKLKDLVTGGLKKAYSKIKPRDPALIIFTTGTTGAPKPALLSHENILTQNEILRSSTDMDSDTRLLINLPPSHVGCVTEGLMTTFYAGGTAVILRIFDVKLTMEAIQNRQVNVLGMIPTQYRMMWAHPDFDKFDLSSLQFAVYAGAAVDEQFLAKLEKMAPSFGTGIGMTESAGFATFTPSGIKAAEMIGQVGSAYPEIADVTIRKPMNDDGSAGEQLPDGEIGEICYHPPIVFIGHYDNEEETRNTISKEGILYTGDLGRFEEKDNYRALFLSGRRKMIIKQKGYNVFPDEVENHIASLEGVDIAEVVGIKHTLFDEGIFAFVRAKSGHEVTPEQVLAHCKSIAAYKRPIHVEIWPEDEELPLTRVAKVDKLSLKVKAEKIVEQLRSDGKWDAS
jgi:fatty-acyl-CoA synthase